MPRNDFKDAVNIGREQAMDDARRTARRELRPLADAVADASFLLINMQQEQRHLREYIAMGRSLRRLLEISGLAPHGFSDLARPEDDR